MSLSSLQIDAFLAVARHQSFSAAAKALGLTQSALSQRVLNLEEELGATLVVREPSGLRLTELGENLLRYGQSKSLLEEEFLASLRPAGATKGLSGLLRVAGFSTISQSLLVPLLGSLTKSHPDVQVELQTAELSALPAILSSGQAEFVFLTEAPKKQGIESHLLGYEENVLVQPSGRAFRENVLLDHNPSDTTTMDFFRLQGKKNVILQRSYLGDIYSLIEGVRHGMGRAVVPLHLVKKTKGLEVVDAFKTLKIPIYLCYYSQAFYTNLQKALIEKVLKEISFVED